MVFLAPCRQSHLVYGLGAVVLFPFIFVVFVGYSLVEASGVFRNAGIFITDRLGAINNGWSNWLTIVNNFWCLYFTNM